MIEDAPVVPGIFQTGRTGSLQSVGIGQRGEIVKAGTHVQRRTVPVKGQVHRPAGGVGRGAVQPFDGNGHKFVNNGFQLFRGGLAATA